MKYLITVLISILLISCSAGGGGSTTPTDPSVSNFVVVPATGVAGTIVTLTFSFDYTSTNGLNTATYTDSGGVSFFVDARACTSSFSSCVVTVNIPLDPTKETFSITLNVVDTKGNRSNTLSANFTAT